MEEVKIEFQNEIQLSENIDFPKVYVKQESVPNDLEDSIEIKESLIDLKTAKKLSNKMEKTMNCELKIFEKCLIQIDAIEEEIEIIDVMKTEDDEESTDDTKEQISLINIDSIKEEQCPVDEIKEQEIEITDVKTEGDEELDVENCVLSNKKEQLHKCKIKGYECKMPQKTFSQNSFVKKRLLIHEKSYKCNICHEAFTQRTSLGEHLLLHADKRERRHKCKMCHKAFLQYSHLKRHLEIHTAEKPHKCKFCDKAFTQKHNLKTHLRVHADEKEKLCECSICHKTFAAKFNLQRHTLLVHTTVHTQKLYECVICHKNFVAKYYLQRHTILVHTKNPYWCEICHKTFSQILDYKKHLLIHKVDTEEIQDERNISDAFKKSLKRNFLICTGEKSHLS